MIRYLLSYPTVVACGKSVVYMMVMTDISSSPDPTLAPTLAPPQLLKDLFSVAVNAAIPNETLASFLPEKNQKKNNGRIIVIGAGKAAASMASALENALEQAWGVKGVKGEMGKGCDMDGLVVTPYAHGVPTKWIEVVEAAHPVPDDEGEAVAKRLLTRVSNLSRDDVVLCLISGGGSALMALPADGLTLADKRDINTLLLKSGAAIDEMNTVRKHLSAIKGGRLGVQANPARVVTLAISDVPGDDPSVIASGPTVPDPTTYGDALAILDKYSISPSKNVVRVLEEGKAGKRDETPKPGDVRLERCEVHIVATPALSLAAAGEAAQRAGYTLQMLGDDIEGEAREIGRQHARLAIEAANAGDKKIAIISGGETTVTVKGDGRGGRNCEYLLGLAIELDGYPNICAIACDSDGIDGTEDNAGALCGPDTLARARLIGLDAPAMLANNDAYSFFEKLGDLVITGPTRTNVNDFRCILVG